MNLISYFERYPRDARELRVLLAKMRREDEAGGVAGNPALRAAREEDARRAEELRAEMERIRAAIARRTPPPNSPRKDCYRLQDEQIFLRCRYLEGMTMERVAEEMFVSRDTVYRIRRRLAQIEVDENGDPVEGSGGPLA